MSFGCKRTPGSGGCQITLAPMAGQLMLWYSQNLDHLRLNNWGLCSPSAHSLQGQGHMTLSNSLWYQDATLFCGCLLGGLLCPWSSWSWWSYPGYNRQASTWPTGPSKIILLHPQPKYLLYQAVRSDSVWSSGIKHCPLPSTLKKLAKCAQPAVWFVELCAKCKCMGSY